MFILTRIARDTLVVHGIHGYSARVPIPFEVNAHKKDGRTYFILGVMPISRIDNGPRRAVDTFPPRWSSSVAQTNARIFNHRLFVGARAFRFLN
jgi:hypothetical protein